MKDRKIEYNKEEFEEKVKNIAMTYNIPEDIIRQDLQEVYDKMEKQYRLNMKKIAKKTLDMI